MKISFKTRRFVHNGIKYDFKLAKLNKVIHNLQPNLRKQLSKYFTRVLEDEIPHDLFEDRYVMRCSNFRIKYLDYKAKPEISKKLAVDNHVLVYNHIDSTQTSSSFPSNISSLTRIAAEICEQTKKPWSADHDTILTACLLQNDNAIAVEVPVWTRQQKRLDDFVSHNEFSCFFTTSLTGHIDLLLYEPSEQCLVVADYKPEGNFLTSLPQVAIYALILKRNLKIKKIKCVSFSKLESWYYSPEILQTIILDEIKARGNPKLAWRKFIKTL